MYYSQRDSRWGDEYIGTSKTKLKDAGCFCTALGNLCGKTPHEVNSILTKGKFFLGDLIMSTQKMAESLGLDYLGRDNMVIRNPKFRTIAEVDASSAVGIQQHFVVIKEDGSIIDSWDGKIKPKGTYPLVSYRLFKVVKTPEAVINEPKIDVKVDNQQNIVESVVTEVKNDPPEVTEAPQTVAIPETVPEQVVSEIEPILTPWEELKQIIIKLIKLWEK